MLKIASRVRASDNFGATPALQLGGETTFKTMGGGIISLCLKFLTFVYVLTQVEALIRYHDPEISSYTVFVDRTRMEKPINLAEHNMRFYFGFLGGYDFKPERIDPAFGKFVVQQAGKWWNSAEN